MDITEYKVKTFGLPSPAFLLCPGDIGGLGLAIDTGDNASGLLGFGMQIE